jgi:uncharacterized membrane protein YbhN (UPF0104 family)
LSFSRHVRLGAVLVTAAILLALVLLVRRWQASGFEVERFLAGIRHTGWMWMLVACLLSLFSYLGRVVRWAVLLEPLRPRPDYAALFRATAIGFTALALLGRPGEIVRPYLIARNEQVPIASQLGAWVVERIYDVLLVCAIFGFALARLAGPGRDLGPNLDWIVQTGGWLTGLFSSLGLLALFALHGHTEWVEKRLVGGFSFLGARHQVRIESFIRNALAGLRASNSRSSVARLILYTIVEWAIIVLAYRALFLAFPETAGRSWTDILVFMGLVSFGGVVQIPGVGGGIQLTAALALTELFAVPLEAATSLALALWIINFVVIIPFGLLLALREGLHWSKLRSIRQEDLL